MTRHDVSFGDVKYVHVQRRGMSHIREVRRAVRPSICAAKLSVDHSEKTRCKQSFAKLRKLTHRRALCSSSVYEPGISRIQVLSFFPEIVPRILKCSQPKRVVDRWQRKSLRPQTASDSVPKDWQWILTSEADCTAFQCALMKTCTREDLSDMSVLSCKCHVLCAARQKALTWRR